ncbi:YxeA family protein [Parablautia muri]|uniref:YxeA family protein n=1 Tax=Parablautia muri TaxID=2320879 RepID=A0A9X5BHQ0_9FIRM|nr:YxeA family protein [Parablautia muri]NBJ94306.1 YxeA family protein [Parablautia muri]
MKKRILSGIGMVILVVVCVCVFLLSKAGSTYYYSQIDNSKMEQGKSGGGVVNFSGSLDYSYTLFSYNEKGKGKDITFGASRELKEGAFIRFTVMPIRGVLEWEEVQYDELPAAVQEQYTTPK